MVGIFIPRKLANTTNKGFIDFKGWRKKSKSLEEKLTKIKLKKVIHVFIYQWNRIDSTEINP